MSDDMTTLALRAIASTHWRWMPGMRLAAPELPASWARLLAVDSPCAEHSALLGGHPKDEWGMVAVWEDDQTITAWGEPGVVDREAIPDLSDQATLGCVRALGLEWNGMTVEAMVDALARRSSADGVLR